MTTCECTKDGFCKRYGREMSGRFREICRGINVDMGTAEAFRQQWLREARPVQSSEEKMTPTSLLLKTNQAPGDALAMTAAIHSLHRAYPHKYVTAVESPYDEIFHDNLDLIPKWALPCGYHEVQMHYPAVSDSNDRGIHFMQGWCEFLGSVLGIHIPLLTNRPHLFFRDVMPVQEDFWLVCSGGKQDMTAKVWPHYQEVIDELQGQVAFVQVGQRDDEHKSLKHVLNLVGQTTLRQLFDLVRRARGVLCGVSLLMHVAAALEKPCIVLAGGREPVQWNSYPKQHYLHTVGMLPCKSYRGRVGEACWRSRTVKLGDGGFLDRDVNVCERPVNDFPECMRLLKSSLVVELIRMYNR